MNRIFWLIPVLLVALLWPEPASVLAAGSGRRASTFWGWSRSGWLAKWSYDTTVGGGPGNAMTYVQDLRTGQPFGIEDAQLGGRTPDAALFAGVRFDGRGRRPAGWRLVVKADGAGYVVTLHKGLRRVRLGRINLDPSPPRPRVVGTYWAPGETAVALELKPSTDRPFHFFRIPDAVHAWKHRLAAVAPCAQFRRWSRCVGRVLPAQRRGLDRTLNSTLAGLRRADPATASKQCAARGAALRHLHAGHSEAASCFASPTPAEDP